MRKFIFTLIIATAITNYSYPQVSQEWVKRNKGFEASSVSASDYIYVTGTSSDSLITIKYSSSGVQQWIKSYSPVFTGHDSPILKIDTLDNVYVVGNSDFGSVLIKYNSLGSQQWVVNFSQSIFRAVEIDKSNNVCITGSASDSIIVEKFVTIKCNSSGIKQWERFYSSPGTNIDGARAVAFDDSGNVYVTGYSILSSSAEYISTLKYNSSGDEQWVRRYGSDTSWCYPRSIAVDNSRNIYVAGYSSDSGIIIKYNSDGAEQWVVNSGGGISLLVDNPQNIYVTGTDYNYTADSAVALKKYNSSGIMQWAVHYSGYESGIDSRIPMTIDNSGDVYISYIRNDNIITAKCNSSGSKQWVQTFNGSGNSDDYSNGIAVDNSGNVYVAGSSIDTIADNSFITIKYSLPTNISTNPVLNAEKLKLEQNFPNPFNPVTTIRYSLKENHFVSLKVYDLLGKEVADLVNTKQNAGNHEVVFDGSNLSSGIYFYKLVTGGFTDTKRMILIK